MGGCPQFWGLVGDVIQGRVTALLLRFVLCSECSLCVKGPDLLSGLSLFQRRHSQGKYLPVAPKRPRYSFFFAQPMACQF